MRPPRDRWTTPRPHNDRSFRSRCPHHKSPSPRTRNLRGERLARHRRGGSSVGPWRGLCFGGAKDDSPLFCTGFLFRVRKRAEKESTISHVRERETVTLWGQVLEAGPRKQKLNGPCARATLSPAGGRQGMNRRPVRVRGCSSPGPTVASCGKLCQAECHGLEIEAS